MIVSKTVRHGDVVTLRGDRYVRTGRGMRVHGVYQKGYRQIIHTNAGLTELRVPDGVVRQGPVYGALTCARPHGLGD